MRLLPNRIFFRFTSTPVENSVFLNHHVVDNSVHLHARGEFESKAMLLWVLVGSPPRPWRIRYGSRYWSKTRRFTSTPVENSNTYLKQYVMKNPEIFPNYLKESNKTSKKDIKTSPKDLARSKDYAWINQNIINKLKNDWGMIEVKTVGKYSYIRLIKRGEDMLKYLT